MIAVVMAGRCYDTGTEEARGKKLPGEEAAERQAQGRTELRRLCGDRW